MFVTDSNGGFDEAMIGRAAEFIPHAQLLDIEDRDYAGYVVAHHGQFPGSGAVGFSSWVPPDPYGGTTCGRARVYTPPSSAGYETGYNIVYTLLTEEMPVGVSDGYNQFQGARSYDSQPGTWTSRDASSGSLDNPMSQTGYTYSGGNPLSTVDPSGLDDTGNGYLGLPGSASAAVGCLICDDGSDFGGAPGGWSGEIPGDFMGGNGHTGPSCNAACEANGDEDSLIFAGTLPLFFVESGAMAAGAAEVAAARLAQRAAAEQAMAADMALTPGEVQGLPPAFWEKYERRTGSAKSTQGRPRKFTAQRHCSNTSKLR